MTYYEFDRHVLTQARAALDLYVPAMQRAAYAAVSKQGPIGVAIQFYRLLPDGQLARLECMFEWLRLERYLAQVSPVSFRESVRALMGR